MPTGKAGQIEAAVLGDDGFTLDDFRSPGALRVKGGRRALRVPITDVATETATDEHGPYIELRFFLPAGSYALSAVREICKSDVTDYDASQADPQMSNPSQSEPRP